MHVCDSVDAGKTDKCVVTVCVPKRKKQKNKRGLGGR